MDGAAAELDELATNGVGGNACSAASAVTTVATWRLAAASKERGLIWRSADSGAWARSTSRTSAALNAGLPVMFDREFGFLNRLLVAPLRSRSSIVFASVLYITTLSLVQSLAIMGTAALLGYGWPGGAGLLLVLVTLLLLVFAVTALSLGLAFALPGHIELIAVIFVANLPLLFASTALAPLSFMPAWLGWLAALNPLTFAIEPIRAAYAGQVSLTAVVLEAPYGQLSSATCLGVLALLAAGLFLLIRPLLDRKLT